jgi:hypothetical protein
LQGSPTAAGMFDKPAQQAVFGTQKAGDYGAFAPDTAGKNEGFALTGGHGIMLAPFTPL